MPAGAVNMWICPDGHHTTAVHLHPGVTPMYLRCRHAGCQQMGTSAGYPPGPVPARVRKVIAYEWARATTTQMKDWKRRRDVMYSYCLAGGLILRPLTSAGAQLVARMLPDPFAAKVGELVAMDDVDFLAAARSVGASSVDIATVYPFTEGETIRGRNDLNFLAALARALLERDRHHPEDPRP